MALYLYACVYMYINDVYSQAKRKLELEPAQCSSLLMSPMRTPSGGRKRQRSLNESLPTGEPNLVVRNEKN